MSSKGEASCGPLKKLSKEDRSIIDTANELLNTLEQSHRADLALHLYSTHLLKTLLRNANRKKSLLEIDVFIKTQIKDNWTSWPNPYTVIAVSYTHLDVYKRQTRGASLLTYG